MQRKHTWKVNVQQGVVHLEGEVDFSVTQAVREFLLNCRPEGQETVVDFSKLQYIDSAGLAVFVEAWRQFRQQGHTIRIVNASEQVRKLFTLTNVAPLFSMA